MKLNDYHDLSFYLDPHASNSLCIRCLADDGELIYTYKFGLGFIHFFLCEDCRNIFIIDLSDTNKETS